MSCRNKKYHHWYQMNCNAISLTKYMACKDYKSTCSYLLLQRSRIHGNTVRRLGRGTNAKTVLNSKIFWTNKLTDVLMDELIAKATNWQGKVQSCVSATENHYRLKFVIIWTDGCLISTFCLLSICWVKAIRVMFCSLTESEIKKTEEHFFHSFQRSPFCPSV